MFSAIRMYSDPEGEWHVVFVDGKRVYEGHDYGLTGEAARDTFEALDIPLIRIERNLEDEDIPDIAGLTLDRVPITILQEAFEHAGVTDPDDSTALLEDVRSGYMNDPKIAGRRIGSCNGDRASFFEFLTGVDWGE